jgi:ABC-2 type transport system permease protein
MRAQIIIADFQASVRTWVRSRGTLFWTLAFPIILILMFGAIFSGVGDVEYTLYVQDLDNSAMSESFLDILKNTGVLHIEPVPSDENASDYIKENNVKRLIVIPEDYSDTINASYVDKNTTVNITMYFDPSETSTYQVVRSIISDVLQSLNMQLTEGRNIVGMQEISTITEEFDFIDFFVPGMIGFTIMQTCIYGSIERNTKFRKNGILRKLLTTPITRTEWIFAKMLFMLFLSFISTIAIVLVGILVYDLTIHIELLWIILLVIVASSFLFSGMGMLIGRFVKEEETADTAGGAISFPMMFLAGTFFPLDQMPGFLQTIARVLPLYYVNEGLRNAMIYLKTSDAIINTVAVLIFASAFFIAGVILTKWKED